MILKLTSLIQTPQLLQLPYYDHDLPSLKHFKALFLFFLFFDFFLPPILLTFKKQIPR